MNVKRMEIKEISGRIWLITANTTNPSEYICKQPSQVKLELNTPSTAEILSGKNVKACVSMILYLKR